MIAFPEYAADVTLHGDSKLRTLFNAFNLGDSNYIARHDAISAEYLIDVYRAAITSCRDNQETTQLTLRSQNELYEAFLARSTMCVH